MNYSKIITALPIAIGLIMIGLEYVTGFEMTQSQVQLIEFLIGGTIFGGVANAGYKRYIDFKGKT